MDKNTYLLLTLVSREAVLYKYFLACESEDIRCDVRDYPLEPENKARIMAMLPVHVQELGEIGEVQHVFGAHFYQPEYKTKK